MLIFQKRFPFYKQLNIMDCGPACLRMIAKYYGKYFKSETIRGKMDFGRHGVSLYGISQAAEELRFHTRAMRLSLKELRNISLPSIIHWNQNHFVVLIKVSKNKFSIADPGSGITTYNVNEFTSHYCMASHNQFSEAKGIILELKPQAGFFKLKSDIEEKLDWSKVYNELWNNRILALQVLITLSLGLFIQLFIPVFSKNLIDTGIKNFRIDLISLIVIGQFVFLASISITSYIRSLLLLSLANNINYRILSDFWSKLVHLPIYFFESYRTGDTIQRIYDNTKIQQFITGPVLNSFFSLLSFLLYSLILVWQQSEIFLIFLAGIVVYISWINIFWKKRRKLNNETFFVSAQQNTVTLQLIQGMQELRLNNADHIKVSHWRKIYLSLFKLNFRAQKFSQLQTFGTTLITQCQSLIITFFTARLVISGTITLGSMMAIQYIVGQLSNSVNQWIGLMQSGQDAKISMARLNEIHLLPNEEEVTLSNIELPQDKSLVINNLTFSYPGVNNDPVLKDVTLTIPENKTTALVGASGSGKTTLLKLLLRMYNVEVGDIFIGSLESNNMINLKKTTYKQWREKCGFVLQEGFIFDDTIVQNIALGQGEVDIERHYLALILAYLE